MLLYPNPAGGSVTIEYPSGGELAIYDPVGRKLIQVVVSESIQTVDISLLPAGVYVVKVTDGGGGEGGTEIGEAVGGDMGRRNRAVPGR